jgi:integrase
VRDVPLHPLIKPLVARLKATTKDGYLINGLKRGGPDNKRNYLVPSHYNRAKKAIGFTDRGLTFHSLRNNFCGALERAGIPETTAQQVAGHKKQSLTYGLYSKGVKLEHLIEAVNKVSHGSIVDAMTVDD